MIDQLIGHLSEEHTAFHEHALAALLSIVRGHPRSLHECRRPELDLPTVLQHKLTQLKDKEQFLVGTLMN